jgi:hypothetical protein
MTAERNKGKKSCARPAHAEPLGELPPGVVASSTGISLPPELPFDDWATICRKVGRQHTSNCWAIGDLWRYGKKYGDHKQLTEDPNWSGPEYHTCANYAWVAGKFESSRRREDLSTRHHAEVAGLPDDEADALLQWSSDTGATVAELKREIFRRKATKIIPRDAPPPRREQDATVDTHFDDTQPELPSPATLLAYPAPQPPQREPPSIADEGTETQLPEPSSPQWLTALPAPQQSHRGGLSISEVPIEAPQPEQSSSGRLLALIARERSQRGFDARWRTLSRALERAMSIAQLPEDQELFRDALNTVQELSTNYLSW